MIVSRTPFRVSFFGGGTDYPEWYLKEGGAVLSTTIDKYCYLTLRHLPPFFDFKHRLVYSVVENVNDPESFNHPAVRGIFKYLNVRQGTSIHHDADLPARSGLGSSSAFTVGLLHAFLAARGESVDKYRLAKMAIEVEQKVIGETVGSQDQVAAAFGGFNRIEFLRDGSFRVEPLQIQSQMKSSLEQSVMVYFTGFSRIASEVAASQTQNFSQRSKELNGIRSLVDQAHQLLLGDPKHLADFGSLLHEGWMLKRGLSDKVSSNKIDEIYDVARRSGALGGKILGAGGGGFILFFVEPEKQAQVRKALPGLLEVKVRFENEGSQIAMKDANIEQERENFL